MAEIKKGTIGILTGGGDVPGLNPAIRAITLRALSEGYRVIGFRRGWRGLIDIVRERDADNSDAYLPLTKDFVEGIGRVGGTALHTSRTRPSTVPAKDVPEHLKGTYTAEKNDLTDEVLANLEFTGVDCLIPIGGDDTLSYGVELARRGVNVVAVPKTMDNDVPGTDYCLGFSTCISRTVSLANQLRTSAASHERVMVIEVFGRYAGFTALLPTLAGAADRCVIPEHEVDPEQLTALLMADREARAGRYASVLVSEGAKLQGGEMVTVGSEKDMFGHAKLGGIGARVSARIKELSPRFNGGRAVEMISMDLGYLVRSGDPDALDSIVPTVYGNLAMDLVLRGQYGRMVALRAGRYDSVPLDTVVSYKKVVDVEKYYDVERLRPRYDAFALQPVFVVGAA